MKTVKRFNDSLNTVVAFITDAVGTMWAAIAFTALALVSLPGALASGSILILIAWCAQTFLQLVLLPIIMVGQRVQAEKTEARDTETHAAVMASHAELRDLLNTLTPRSNR